MDSGIDATDRRRCRTSTASKKHDGFPAISKRRLSFFAGKQWNEGLWGMESRNVMRSQRPKCMWCCSWILEEEGWEELAKSGVSQPRFRRLWIRSRASLFVRTCESGVDRDRDRDRGESTACSS